MQDSEMIIAIAEACGWKRANGIDRYWMDPKGSGRGEEFLPDYPNDLNAMYLAEQTLFTTKVWQLSEPDRVAEYKARLDIICVGHAGGSFRATARQRAEAFLRTLGRWRETQYFCP